VQQITKRQHIVPRFYLAYWNEPGTNVIHLHDLERKTRRTTSPAAALAEQYYYEYDRNLPDNFVENVLSQMENHAAPAIRSIHELVQKYHSYSEDRAIRRDFSDLLTYETRTILKEFAAYQYLRIPGAIEQKAYEMRPANIPADILKEHLKPANFVTTGFDYIKDRFFQELFMVISYSFDYEFVTSDWPCFDFKDSRYAPALGREIGSETDVFLIFPLLPRVLMTLLPRKALPGIIKPSEPVVQWMSEGDVKNVNSMIIQQARRWIVYNREDDSIFNAATKRLK
jgi:hypothetical protein